MVLDSDLYYWAEFLYFLLCFALFLWWFLISILHNLKIQTNIYIYIYIYIYLGHDWAWGGGAHGARWGGFKVKKCKFGHKETCLELNPLPFLPLSLSLSARLPLWLDRHHRATGWIIVVPLGKSWPCLPSLGGSWSWVARFCGGFGCGWVCSWLVLALDGLDWWLVAVWWLGKNIWG